MSEGKCLSVIIPVYNVHKYIGRCLDSLYAQKYNNLDIIVIDDGSTDGSGDICDYYANRYPYIKIVHIPNGGVSNARNVALSLVTGDYVAFVDGDDWIAEDFFAIGMNVLEQSSADIFIGSYVKSYEDGMVQRLNENMHSMLLTRQECIEKIFVQKFKQTDLSWAVWGKIYKTSLWKNVKFKTNISVGEDGIAFWDVLKNAEKIAYEPINGYYYFQRTDSVMHTMSIKNISDELMMYKYFFEQSRSLNLKYVKEYFYYRYYLAHINAVIALSCQENISHEFYDNRKVVYKNFGSCLYSAWSLDGVKGILKLIISMMPAKLGANFMNSMNKLKCRAKCIFGGGRSLLEINIGCADKIAYMCCEAAV